MTGSKNALWTLAEQYQGRLKGVSFELLAWGRGLADKLGVSLVSVLIGQGVEEDSGNDSLKELIRRGADEVLVCQDPRLGPFICENYARALEKLVRQYEPAIILAAATSTGRTLMPYTAVRLHAGLTADCTGLDIEEGTGNLLQTRPAIGGNIMATIKTPDRRPQMATVRPRSSRPLPRDEGRKGRIISVPFEEAFLDGRVEHLSYRREESDFINPEEADVVVAGGRGLKKAENFGMVKKLAESLGAAAGASRDAVDRGWASYPHQIGLSGKTVSPRLYLGIGISGAIQHLAGIKTSECIVSVNNDPEAAIHKLADLAIVGDAFQVIPELQKRIAQRLETRHGAKGGHDEP